MVHVHVGPSTEADDAAFSSAVAAQDIALRVPAKHFLKTVKHPRIQLVVTMAGSPTPEEREKADAELKAKEEAEQAKLPYKWTQTIKDVDVTISIDGKYKGRDLDVKLTKTALRVAIKGQEPFIDVLLPHIFPASCLANKHERASSPTPFT